MHRFLVLWLHPSPYYPLPLPIRACNKMNGAGKIVFGVFDISCIQACVLVFRLANIDSQVFACLFPYRILTPTSQKDLASSEYLQIPAPVHPNPEVARPGEGAQEVPHASARTGCQMGVKKSMASRKRACGRAPSSSAISEGTTNRKAPLNFALSSPPTTTRGNISFVGT